MPKGTVAVGLAIAVLILRLHASSGSSGLPFWHGPYAFAGRMSCSLTTHRFGRLPRCRPHGRSDLVSRDPDLEADSAECGGERVCQCGGCTGVASTGEGLQEMPERR